MNDVPEILQQATGDPIAIDVAADLRRGRTALKRRRTRISAGVAGIAAAGIVGAVALPQLAPGSAPTKGGGEQPGWATSSPSDEPTSDAVATYLAKQQEFVDCVRKNGAPDMPDPDEFGAIVVTIDTMPQGKPGRRMMATCGPITAGLEVPPELQAKRDDYLAARMTAEEKQIEVDYATCMQDNGVPEYPNPQANGLPATPEWDLPSPQVAPPAGLEEASLACRTILGDDGEEGDDMYQAADPTRPEFFDLTMPPPGGWQVVDHNPNGVMIARDGETGGFNTSSFVGKIMVLLSDESTPMNHGAKVEFNGRTFYDNQVNEDSVILNVQLDSGDWLQVQYPRDAALDRDEMLHFLDGVVVKPGTIGTTG